MPHLLHALLIYHPHRSVMCRSIVRNSLDRGIKNAATKKGAILRSSAADFNTAYEWLEKQREPPISEYVKWMDPIENPCSSPPCREMGFDIHREEEKGEKSSGVESSDDVVRLPIYPLPAVYLPSSAFQTLHNVQTRNIRMAQDLNAGKWNISPNEILESGVVNNETYGDVYPDGGYFVATLRAQDTDRTSTVGTLMKVIALNEDYALDKRTLTRIVITAQAVGIVEIQGVEKEISEDDYWIGKVKFLEMNHFLEKNSRNDCAGASTMNVNDDASRREYRHTKIDNTNVPSDESVIHRIVEDYSTVRSMYVHPTNGVSSRELPTFAQDSLVDNLPPFTPEDFTCRKDFWNVVECWQMLCNTVREAHRSKLQMELNEIMIKAACDKGGPLTLPVKKHELPNNIQARLKRMENEANDDFVSLGMDPCLDFQALLGMSISNEAHTEETSDDIHVKRVVFFGNMIRKERDRLEAKEKLKAMFRRGAEDREESRNSFQ